MLTVVLKPIGHDTLAVLEGWHIFRFNEFRLLDGSACAAAGEEAWREGQEFLGLGHRFIDIWNSVRLDTALSLQVSSCAEKSEFLPSNEERQRTLVII